jgi:folate-binding protein YgfZ
MTPYPADYTAALHGAAFYHHHEGGLLRLEGPDRAAFLQRQCSNDLRRLGPGRALVTALTSPTARILDVFILVDDGETLLALTLPGYAAATGKFLRSRIFFMDKVNAQDVSAGYAQLDLEGPASGEALAAFGFARPPKLDEVERAEIAGRPCWAIGQRGLSGSSWRLLFAGVALPSVQAALTAAGALPLTEASYQALRVEAGLPAAFAELTEVYTPYEAGLGFAVASDKGCYTGQEVLARQMTYDKITQRLAGLRLEAMVEPGARVEAEGKPAGVVTSTAFSPRLGAIALAVLKRHALAEGTAVQAAGQGGIASPGVVVSLPFPVHGASNA